MIQVHFFSLGTNGLVIIIIIQISFGYCHIIYCSLLKKTRLKEMQITIFSITHHIALCRFLLVVLKVTELLERFSALSTKRSSFSPLSMRLSMLVTMMSFTWSTSSRKLQGGTITTTRSGFLRNESSYAFSDSRRLSQGMP